MSATPGVRFQSANWGDAAAIEGLLREMLGTLREQNELQKERFETLQAEMRQSQRHMADELMRHIDQIPYRTVQEWTRVAQTACTVIPPTQLGHGQWTTSPSMTGPQADTMKSHSQAQAIPQQHHNPPAAPVYQPLKSPAVPQRPETLQAQSVQQQYQSTAPGSSPSPHSQVVQSRPVRQLHQLPAATSLHQPTPSPAPLRPEPLPSPPPSIPHQPPSSRPTLTPMAPQQTAPTTTSPSPAQAETPPRFDYTLPPGDRVIPQICYTYRLSRSIKTLADVDQEYRFGLGNSPPVWWLECYIPDWRKNRDDEKQYVSRRKIIWIELDRLQRHFGGDRNTAVKELERNARDNGWHSLNRIMNGLKHRGKRGSVTASEGGERRRESVSSLTQQTTSPPTPAAWRPLQEQLGQATVTQPVQEQSLSSTQPSEQPLQPKQTQQESPLPSPPLPTQEVSHSTPSHLTQKLPQPSPAQEDQQGRRPAAQQLSAQEDSTHQPSSDQPYTAPTESKPSFKKRRRMLGISKRAHRTRKPGDIAFAALRRYQETVLRSCVG